MAAACEGKAPSPTPATPPQKDAAPPVAVDAAIVSPTAGTGEPAPRKPPAVVLREAALPARTPCKAECNEKHIPVAASACTRHAQENDDPAGTVQIQLLGERTKGPCEATSVEIDCCPSLKPTDYKGIALRLGWANAGSEERKAIAWVMARVVFGGRIIDEDTHSSTTVGLSMPEAHEEKGALVLDYWFVPDGAHTATFIHEELRFAESGHVTRKKLDEQTLISP